MQVAILGPLEIRGDDGRLIEVSGARLRSLLLRLALEAGRPVGLRALADAVWGEQLPADEANALQTLVSRLRRALGGATMIGQSPAGYRLGIERRDVDAYRFEHLAAEGAAALRAGDAEAAARQLREALGLWRGPALIDADDFAAADASRLQDRRLTALLDRVDADLALGDASMVVAELEARGADYPLHERLTGQLMRALAATGRQADALAAYERVRARLADELGVDPSAELQAVHLAVLRGEHSSAPLAPPRTNLKAQLTSFVGRDEEVARIAKSLGDNRLVTLVGPGGAGKTRLAGEAAATIIESAPDGVWLVELAPVTDAADLPQTVLGSLGIRQAYLLDRHSQLTARDAIDRLLDALADKQAVLILDNCEHLIDASARLADNLLAQCPKLRVLTTSREPLGIVGEVLLVVPPLGQPEPAAGAAEALAFPAVRLFADRAAAVRPAFEIDEATISTVIDIVRRLDGLPLAIELAAARLRSLPLAEIAERLSDRFRLLTGGSRTAMPRHRTLRAVVEWSWELLTQAERTLAERLAVFPAGATIASASAVCADSAVPAADVRELLASLVDKSLLQPVADGTRLRMLETIREYGLERLAEQSALAQLRQRHADYFADLLSQAQPHLISADQLPWFALLRAERDNILAAIRFRADTGDADGALELAVFAAGFSMLLGNHSEVPIVVGEALAVSGGSDTSLRAMAEAMFAMNAVMSTAEPGSDSSVEGMAMLHAIGDRLDEIALDPERYPMAGLICVGIAFFTGDTDRAERYVQAALDCGNAWTAAAVLMFRANLYENVGDVAAMRVDTDAALAEFRRMGERWGMASTLRGSALLHTLDGDLDAAEADYAEALALMREMSSRDDEGFMRVRLADLRMRRGDLVGAREQMRLARSAATSSGSAVEFVVTLCMSAAVEQEAGDLEQARRLHAEAVRLVEAIPAGHPILNHAQSMMLVMSTAFATTDGDLDLARRLGRQAYAAATGTTDMPIVALAGVALAALVAREGEPARAAQMLGATAVLRGADDPTSVQIARLTAELTATLGASDFTDAYAAGRGLDRDAALALLEPASD